MIAINRPNSAVLYSWGIVYDDFNEFCCTFRHYLCDRTIECWAMPTKTIVHVHRAGTIQGWGLLWSARAIWPVREQFKGGKNSRKYGSLHLHMHRQCVPGPLFPSPLKEKWTWEWGYISIWMETVWSRNKHVMIVNPVQCMLVALIRLQHDDVRLSTYHGIRNYPLHQYSTIIYYQ